MGKAIDIRKHEDRKYLSSLIPIKEFNAQSKDETISHLNKVIRKVLDHTDNTKTICAIMAYLWDTETDETRKQLILEAAWIGVRMNKKLDEYRRKR